MAYAMALRSAAVPTLTPKKKFSSVAHTYLDATVASQQLKVQSTAVNVLSVVLCRGFWR